MVKGASIRFKSYGETVQKLLGLLKLQNELKKYDKIVLKPWISADENSSTPIAFVEAVLRFVLENKNPIGEVFIAEGVDGGNTSDLFEERGYNKLAEKYSIGLVDLNKAEVKRIENPEFSKFDSINYPQILLDSFVISLPALRNDEESGLIGPLSNMLGAFPADYYGGFFTGRKKKIRRWPMKYSIHDIIQCKMPNFAVVDASERGMILAGLTFEMDKQSAKILGKESREVGYLKLIEENLEREKKKEQEPEEEF